MVRSRTQDTKRRSAPWPTDRPQLVWGVGPAFKRVTPKGFLDLAAWTSIAVMVSLLILLSIGPDRIGVPLTDRPLLIWFLADAGPCVVAIIYLSIRHNGFLGKLIERGGGHV